MHPLRYNALVASLEAAVASRPAALRRRVLALVALGYGYVLAVLLLLVAALALTIVGVARAHAGGLVKLVFVLGALAWMIARSLWVRVQPPQGRVLQPGTAPALERRVEEVRAALAAPRAHTVLLTDDFNASVTQVPRLGIFGWPRTYLTLGLPLMHALDVRHFDAVLAHEFAHLSGAHPKLGLWVYRTSRTWSQLLENMSGHRVGRAIFAPFFRWYIPRMRAHGFVLSRRDEFEADAEAAGLVGPAAMGEALAALEVRAQALEEHAWPTLLRAVHTSPAVPERAWSTVTSVIRHELTPVQQSAWLGRAMRRVAVDDDTHPSLAERLRALGGFDPDTPDELAERLAPSGGESAAGHYLGPLAGELLSSLDDAWRDALMSGWSERHAELAALRARAAELAARDGAEQSLEPFELWELAGALGELEDERLVPVLHRAVAAMPANAAAHHMLGSALLAAGDADGVAHLRRAMALDASLTGGVLQRLRAHYAATSDRAALESLQVEEHSLGAVFATAADERGDVAKGDRLLPAALDEEVAARVREVVAARPELAGVRVARKRITTMIERPMYIALVDRPVPWWRRSDKADQRLAQEMLDELAPVLPGDLLVIVHRATTNWLLRKMTDEAGAEPIAA